MIAANMERVITPARITLQSAVDTSTIVEDNPILQLQLSRMSRHPSSIISGA